MVREREVLEFGFRVVGRVINGWGVGLWDGVDLLVWNCWVWKVFVGYLVGGIW